MLGRSFSLNIVNYARFKSIPVSSISQPHKMHLLPMIGTIVSFGILFLWQQKLMLLAPALSAAISANAAVKCVALNKFTFGLVLGWGLLCSGGLFLSAVVLEIYHCFATSMNYPWIGKKLILAWNPSKFLKPENRDLILPQYGTNRSSEEIDDELLSKFDLLHKLRC